MDPDVLNFAQVSAIIVMLAGSLIAIGIIAWKSVTKTKSAPQMPQVAEARLEQLQQSIDAIAIEVERIAEAQRFSAKLLAERSETSGIPR